MKFGVLRITAPDGAVREYPLDIPTIVVGRGPGNSITLDDLSIARRHARLTVDSGHLFVEDLGSSSGTFVGGQRLIPNNRYLVENANDLRAVITARGPSAPCPADLTDDGQVNVNDLLAVINGWG